MQYPSSVEIWLRGKLKHRPLSPRKRDDEQKVRKRVSLLQGFSKLLLNDELRNEAGAGRSCSSFRSLHTR